MPEYTQVPVNQFVGGLVTERGELTFPEGASVDELNMDLLKTGARRRRLGIEIEAASSPTTETLGANTVVTLNKWENVGEQADTNFTVLQVGATLMFFDEGDGSGSLSSNRVDTTLVSGVEYSLDMSTYQRPTGNGAGAEPIQTASIKGALIVASPELNTFYITRDTSTGAFTVTEITFRTRDFDWQGDITTYDTAIATGSVSNARIYDTQNAGWTGGAIGTYTAGTGNYPPLTLPWYSGKDASGNFSVAEWNKIDKGTTLIGNGRYIVDLYMKDRSVVDAALSTTENSRFSSVAAYSGRVWYSGMNDSSDDNGNKVYFSQILEHGYTNLGELLQVNDPSSEVLSDLLDTDGGFIVIPEAHQIRKLHPFGPYLYVFASNGVWQIGGVDDVFRATDYTISKLSEDGLSVVGSFVSAQGQPYWWSNDGIFRLAPGEQGTIGAQNMSISTIQTFWESIDADKRDLVRGVYDQATRRVIWFYADDTETNEIKKNNLLFWDEVLQAFFPWKVSDETTNTNYIVDATFISGVGTNQTTSNVITNGGDLVETSGGDQVVTTISSRSSASSKAKYLVVDGDTGKFTFAEFTDTAFTDWGSEDYTSFVEGAYSFMGDLETRKSSPYVTVFMKDTATGFNDEGSGVYSVVRDSSCLLSAYYDFNRTATSSTQQCFRRKNTPAVDTGDLSSWTYPRTVIASRLKLRGRGRSMRVRFESEAGKDFHLLGYNVIIARPGKF